MFRHVVMLRWVAEATPEQRSAVTPAVLADPLPARHPRDPQLHDRCRRARERRQLRSRRRGRLRRRRRLPRVPRSSRPRRGDQRAHPPDPRRSRRRPARDRIAGRSEALAVCSERVVGAGAGVSQRCRRDAALPGVERRPRDAGERRQRDRRRAGRQPRARGRDALHVRRRRRSARDGLRRRRPGVPRCRARAARRDARRGARPVGRGDDADVRSASVHRPRRRRRLVHAARALGNAIVRRGERDRVGLRRGRLPAHQAGRVLLQRQCRRARALRIARLPQRLRRTGSGLVDAPTGARPHVAGARRRRSRRLLPRSDRRSDRAAAARGGRVHDRRRPGRAPGRVGRAAARDGARHRDPRDAAADAGHHRARGACASSTVSTSAPTGPTASTS